jgi:hypothetical protein
MKYTLVDRLESLFLSLIFLYNSFRSERSSYIKTLDGNKDAALSLRTKTLPNLTFHHRNLTKQCSKNGLQAKSEAKKQCKGGLLLGIPKSILFL